MNGTIKFLKKVNKGNYEYEEAAAEIQFGDEEHIERAQTEAVARVYAMLGLTEVPTIVAGVKLTGPDEELVRRAIALVPDPIISAPPPVVEKPIADTHGGVVPPEQIMTGIGPIVAAAKRQRKAEKAIPVGTPVESSIPAPVEHSDWTSETPVITVADLGRACSQKLEGLGGQASDGRSKIAELIGKFIGPGKKLAELPVEVRPQFLTELAQLA